MTVVSRRGSADALVARTTILSTASSERPHAAPLPDKVDAALQRLLKNPLNGVSKVRVILTAKPGRVPSQLQSRRLDTTVPVGGQWLTSGLPTTSMIGGTSTTWSQHVVWGDSTFDQDSVAWRSVSTNRSTPANPLAMPQP